MVVYDTSETPAATRQSDLLLHFAVLGHELNLSLHQDLNPRPTLWCTAHQLWVCHLFYVHRLGVENSCNSCGVMLLSSLPLLCNKNHEIGLIEISSNWLLNISQQGWRIDPANKMSSTCAHCSFYIYVRIKKLLSAKETLNFTYAFCFYIYMNKMLPCQL